MQWSQLKKRIEDLSAPALAGRVKFYVAKYRNYNEEYGRAVLLIDAEEVCEFSDFDYEKAEKKEIIRIHQDSPEAETASPAMAHLIERSLHDQGVYSLDDFYGALESYLSMSVTKALASADLIIRILVVLDRRVGKRRLATLRDHYAGFPVLKRLYELRCASEGLEVS